MSNYPDFTGEASTCGIKGGARHSMGFDQPSEYFAKICSARRNALSTAASGVMLFLITSASATPQSCSALTCPQAGL